jgi:hypothetical protein
MFQLEIICLLSENNTIKTKEKDNNLVLHLHQNREEKGKKHELLSSLWFHFSVIYSCFSFLLTWSDPGGPGPRPDRGQGLRLGIFKLFCLVVNTVGHGTARRSTGVTHCLRGGNSLFLLTTITLESDRKPRVWNQFAATEYTRVMTRLVVLLAVNS